MNIDEVKKLIKNSTAVLVLDDGQPSFVIVGYETYKKLATDKNSEEREVKINPVRSSLAGGDSSRGSSAGTFALQVPEGTRASGASETLYGINSVEHNRPINIANGFGHRSFHGGVNSEVIINRNQATPEKESEILERLNKEILALKQQIEAEEKGLSSSGVDGVD